MDNGFKISNNPFITGQPVYGSYFIGRSDIIEKVFDFLRNVHEYNFLLYGQRRIGKTSILRQLEREINKINSFAAIYINLQDKSDLLLPQLIKEISEQIKFDLKTKTNTTAEAENPEKFYKHFLPEIIKLSGKEPVILFDEFDAIVSTDLIVEPEFSNKAKNAFISFVCRMLEFISSNKINVKFVFAVGRNFKDLDQNKYGQLTKFGPKTELNYFEKNIINDLLHLAKPFIEFSEEAKNAIFTLTSGHPLFAQCLAASSFIHAEKQKLTVVSEKIVRERFLPTIESYGSNVYWIWDSLSVGHKTVLYILTQLINENQDSSEKRIRQKAEQLNLAPALKNLPTLIQQLENNLFIKKNQGQLRFYSEFFQVWVQKEINYDNVKTLLPQIDADVQFLMANTEYYFNKKDYKKSLEFAEQLLQFNIIQPNLLLLVARCYWYLNQYDKAWNFYKQTDIEKYSNEVIDVLNKIIENKKNENEDYNEYQNTLYLLNPEKDNYEQYIKRLEFFLDIKFQLVQKEIITTIKLRKTAEYSLDENNKISGICLAWFGFTEIPVPLIELFDQFNLTHLNLIGNQLNNINDLSPNKNLIELVLFDNKLSDISTIKNFKKIQKLHLNYNEISDITELKQLTELTFLLLYHNNISELTSLKDLKKLKDLNLSENQIININPLSELTQLELLDLSQNKISNISALKNLTQLKAIYLQDNQIDDISPLTNLKRVTRLDLRKNPISKLSDWICNFPKMDIAWKDTYLENTIIFFDNPIETPPVEIIKLGKNGLNNWFKQQKEQGSDYLYEAKMLIIGEGEAGKTTLANKIENPGGLLSSVNDRTRGITIRPHYFEIEDKIQKKKAKFRLNIWDFGGQEMYHATHRFFLSKRSLYVLVADNRKDQTNFDYWLEIVELFACNSPVIIVLNEKDDLPKEININDIRARFENVKDIFSLNLRTAEEFDLQKRGLRMKKINRLIEEIEHYAKNLPHIGDSVPARWVSIRNDLEKSKENYLEWKQFKTLCFKFGVEAKEDVELLSSYFHDIGVILHFQDNPLLKKTIILKPAWATNAVYKIFDNDVIRSKQGRFTKSDLFNLWNEPEYADMHDELFEIMKKFKLLYETDSSDNLIIAPQMLSDNKPDYIVKKQDTTYFKYKYEVFMPQGILWHAIVTLNRLIKNQDLVWKSGFVVEYENTYAEIIENQNQRQITIKINGANKIGLLSIIRNTINDINETYYQLKVEQLIPCNCSICKTSESPHFYKYSNLLYRKEKGKQTVECDISFEDVKVRSLIDDVIEENNINRIRNFSQLRLKHLNNQLKNNYKLLNQYENKLEIESDPIAQQKCRTEIHEIKQKIREIEKEISSL